jgi:hypothetical protein
MKEQKNSHETSINGTVYTPINVTEMFHASVSDINGSSLKKIVLNRILKFREKSLYTKLETWN